MTKEKYNQIIDEAYENYKTEIIRQRESQKKHVEKLRSQGKRLKVTRIELLSQDEFINKIKTDSKFSETWGLKIEERELSLEERWAIADLTPNMEEFDFANYMCDKHNVPTKQITITYNNETIESYEI